jgi:hypothetical protein
MGSPPTSLAPHQCQPDSASASGALPTATTYQKTTPAPFASLPLGLRTAIAVQAEILISLLPEDKSTIAVSLHVWSPSSEFTVFKITDDSIVTPGLILSGFKMCFTNKLCSEDFERPAGKFDFGVFERAQGVTVSPLIFRDSLGDNSNVFAYSKTDSQDGLTRTITVYFQLPFPRADSPFPFTLGQKYALLASNRPSHVQPLWALFNGKLTPSHWRLNINDESYATTVKALFSAGLEKGSVFVKEADWGEAEVEWTSAMGVRIRAVVGWKQSPGEVGSAVGGVMYHSAGLSKETALFGVFILGGFFIYKYSLLSSFVMQILTSVLKDIKDLSAIVRDENIFATNFDHIHFKEIRDLVIQVANYKMLVQFIATIKSKDALNPMKLKHFLLPFQNTDNHIANVYLFNFFSRFL